MFLVVVNTPDGQETIGPIDSVQEALWRRDYEHRCAEHLYGYNDRLDIGARVVRA